MRHLSIAAIAAASTITFTQVAAAAPPPPAPVYSWTGFYIGGNVGYSWGDAHTDITGSGSTTAFLGFPNTPPGGFPASFGFADSNTGRLDGVIGGGQIGYNYQLNPKWVLGIEADIQGSGERGSNTFLDTFSTPLCGALGGTGILNCFQNGTLNGTAVTTYEAKIKWFGTVRGRVGYLITDRVLFYGTGGLAYGGVELSGNTNISSTFTFPPILAGNGTVPFPSSSAAFGASKTNVGFSVGGGIEGSVWLPANWTWKLEYLYLDLGSLNVVTSFIQPSIPNVPSTSPVTGTIATHAHFTDNIVRVGLNYKFH